MGLSGEDTVIHQAPQEKAVKRQLVPADAEDLMQLVSQGDRQAFDNLYQRYILRVAGYFRQRQPSSVVDDLSQEVFFCVWNKRHKYRNGTPDYAWLMGFARNILLEQVTRVRAKSKEKSDAALDSIADTSQQSPQRQAQTSEQTQALRDLMANLPERQRQAIELVHLKGFSSSEASRMLGCTDRTIRKYCEKGLMKLRVLMRSKE